MDRDRTGGGIRVCLGGTFDPLHEGHAALLARAFQVGKEVLIGLTGDEMAGGKEGGVALYATRKAALERFLRERGWTSYTVAELEDPYGPAAHREDLNAIVVTPETEPTARALNETRHARGLPPLEILQVDLVPAEDGLPIRSSRIRRGEIDATGRLLRPVRVRVGTGNPVKVEAVRRVLNGLFDRVEVDSVEVDPGVPPQPQGREALRGALNRARRALGEADLGVGIEAGLVRQPGVRRDLDVQFCVVVDRGGRVTVGTGPGFEHPPTVLRMVADGFTVGEAMERLTGVPDIGTREGAIGHLSEGRMGRTRLTEAAVLMAMVPRIRRALYRDEGPGTGHK